MISILLPLMTNEKEEQSEPADDSSTGDNGERLDKRRVNIQTWHRRLAHLSIRNVVRLSTMVDGMDIKGLSVPKHACEPCKVAKAEIQQHRRQMISKVKRPCQRIFLDLGGGHHSMPASRFSGAKYWMLRIDDFTSFVWVKFLKLKSMAWQAIFQLTAELERMGYTVQVYHTDNGGEFDNGRIAT
jgi:GAG-pre-integrase domain